MSWLRASLLAQALLALYFQAIQWLPLGRWNFQPGFEPFGPRLLAGRASVADALPLAAFHLPLRAFWVADSRRWRWLMWIGVVGYGTWLALQIKSWWLPYLFGASDRWAETQERVFRHSTQLLPTFGRHLPPDAMHFILQLLLLAVIALTVVGLWKTSGRAGPARPGPSR